MLYFAFRFSSHPSVIMCHHQPLFTAISKIITHRSEVVPEYEPGGASSQADTADNKVEQTHSKEACTSGDTKHRDQGVFFFSHSTWSIKVIIVKIIGSNWWGGEERRGWASACVRSKQRALSKSPLFWHKTPASMLSNSHFCANVTW